MLEATLLGYSLAFLISFFTESLACIYTVTVFLLHEAGHILCITALKMPKTKISITPFMATIRFYGSNDISDMWVALSGPLMNLISGVVFLLTFKKMGYPFFILSFFVGILNLLPIEGLDGAVALRALFSLIEGRSRCCLLLTLLSDVCLFGLWVISAYRMLKYGDSFFIFFFCLRCASRNLVTRKTHA